MTEISYLYLTDEEMAKHSGKLIPGSGTYEIISATDGISKTSHNPQFVLELRIWDEQGTQGQTKDYFPLTEKMAWKVKQLLTSLGYEYKPNGKLDLSEIINKSGQCKLKIEKTKDDFDNEKEFIKVGAYLPPKKNDMPSRPANEIVNDSDLDDDIPF